MPPSTDPAALPSPPAVIASAADLQTFLSSISAANTLYVDLEGENLGRHGTISLIIVLVYPEKVLRLVDVQTLQGETFTVTDAGGSVTLKSVLEDPRIRKCFWDVRNDADALWARHRVGLAGVLDVQLLENATRAGDATFVHGLGKCIQADLRLGFMALNRWQRTKSETTSKMTRDRWQHTKSETTNKMAMHPFAVRPLDKKIVQYCVNDVVHLPALQAVYTKRMGQGKAGGACRAKVEAASAARVAQTRLRGYDPQGPTKRRGPWGVGNKAYSLARRCSRWMR